MCCGVRVKYFYILLALLLLFAFTFCGERTLEVSNGVKDESWRKRKNNVCGKEECLEWRVSREETDEELTRSGVLDRKPKSIVFFPL